MFSRLTESDVEQAALMWLEGLGWQVKHGPELAPGELTAERGDYSRMVLEQQMRDALLPKLISGELRVKDPENFIGRVV